jgi:ribosome-binding protein aMBF1 (putative translation factor)
MDRTQPNGERDEHEIRVNQDIGQRLRDLRQTRELTQQQVADAVGITVRHLRRYEIGMCQLSPARLLVVADALNIPLDYLLTGSAAMTNHCDSSGGGTTRGERSCPLAA